MTCLDRPCPDEEGLVEPVDGPVRIDRYASRERVDLPFAGRDSTNLSVVDLHMTDHTAEKTVDSAFQVEKHSDLHLIESCLATVVLADLDAWLDIVDRVHVHGVDVVQIPAGR